MPLVKTIELPGGMGQHFFFDMGNDDCLAFFWFAGAPAAQPGVSNPSDLPDRGDITSAHASMNHLAFDVPFERFEEYRQRLVDEGIEVSAMLDHDDSEYQVARTFHPACSCARSTSVIPTGSCSSSPRGPARWVAPTTSRSLPVDAAGRHVES